MRCAVKSDLLGITFRFYVGREEWPAWYRAVKRSAKKCGEPIDLDGEDPVSPPRGRSVGRTWGRSVWTSDSADLPLLVHELTHSVRESLRDLEYNEADDELHARVMEHLFGRVLKKLEKARETS